jgi:hypothetical protein
MIENVLHPRIVENREWATALFVLSFATIAMTRSVFANRFTDFANLIFSDKFMKVYKDSSQLKSGFTIALFFVQVISIAFFIQLSLASFGYISKTDWVKFIQIITLLFYFILSKYLIDKIIGTAFDMEEFVDQFNLQKVNYRSYIGLIILPINVILYYYDVLSRNTILMIIPILLITNIITYIVLIKTNHKIIFSKMFYFILYLCALEIAPYYFIYYWFTKGLV